MVVSVVTTCPAPLVCRTPDLAAQIGVCAVAVTLVSATILSRFGINLGSYSADFSLIALYGLLLSALLSGRAALVTTRLALYGLGMTVAAASFFVNTSQTSGAAVSVSSLALLAVIYFPFAWTVPAASDDRFGPRSALRIFDCIALICACGGIAQFSGQYVIKSPLLFDFTPLLPTVLQGPSGYNTVIEVGDLFKANGFFLREPSTFSFLMGLAIVIELNRPVRRPWRLGLYVCGLLLSYSGTGLLALLLGLIFPLSARSVLRLGAAVSVAFIVYLVLADALNLEFTANRVAEFSSDRSSAYIRYIAPFHAVAGAIDLPWWALLIGHGPGSITRTSHGVQTFDPTWAKVIFEYGVLGLVSFVCLIYLSLRSFHPSIRAVLFASWLVMGGHLLSPENMAILFALCGMWTLARPQFSIH